MILRCAYQSDSNYDQDCAPVLGTCDVIGCGRATCPEHGGVVGPYFYCLSHLEKAQKAMTDGAREVLAHFNSSCNYSEVMERKRND